MRALYCHHLLNWLNERLKDTAVVSTVVNTNALLSLSNAVITSKQRRVVELLHGSFRRQLLLFIILLIFFGTYYFNSDWVFASNNLLCDVTFVLTDSLRCKDTLITSSFSLLILPIAAFPFVLQG